MVNLTIKTVRNGQVYQRATYKGHASRNLCTLAIEALQATHNLNYLTLVSVHSAMLNAIIDEHGTPFYRVTQTGNFEIHVSTIWE